MNLDKYVTQGVLVKLNTFIEKQSNVPFKLQNVYRMVDMIIQTYSQNMDQAILDIFDRITMHYSENRYMVEGWRTNSQYMINEKIIFPSIVGLGWSGQFEIIYNGYNVGLVNDLTKALCYLTGTRYEPEMDIYTWGRLEHREFGQWYDWYFFEVKGYKKGTCHMKFKNRDHWALLNQRIAKLKGWGLPEKF